MIRFAFIALLFASAAQAQDTSTLAPLPKLKAAVTVASDLVRIGDLFENAGERADIPVFRAPDLGESGSVTTASIVEAVRAHDMYLFDTGDVATVTVSHSSRTIMPKDVEARVLSALADRHGLGPVENLSLVNDRALRMFEIEATATGELRVIRLNYDPRTTRFDALIDLPQSTILRRTPLRLTGSVVETVEIALTARALGRGDTIKASDLVRERRPKANIDRDALTGLANAVGLAARRGIRAGHLLRRADLMKPELVERNSEVTITYQVPGIVLSTRGKAMEAGAAGDLIRVENLQSKRTVQAVVTGPGHVAVSAQSTRIVARLAAQPAMRAAAPAPQPAPAPAPRTE